MTAPVSAFYAGSFDPFTNGHLGVIEQALNEFDRIVVGIGHNPNKKPFLPLETRLEIIRTIFRQKQKITVIAFDTYLVSAAAEHGCQTIIRGVRNSRDAEDEALLAAINDNLCEDLGLPHLQTKLFHAAADKTLVSSSMVKAMIGFNDWEIAVKRYVPDVVIREIKQMLDTKK